MSWPFSSPRTIPENSACAPAPVGSGKVFSPMGRAVISISIFILKREQALFHSSAVYVPVFSEREEGQGNKRRRNEKHGLIVLSAGHRRNQRHFVLVAEKGFRIGVFTVSREP